MTTQDEQFLSDQGIAADSRFLDGHFPGNPIVPGAMILGWLADRLAPSNRWIARVDRMKFVKPLRPGVPFSAVLKQQTQVEFRDAHGLVARARVALRTGHG